VFVGDHLISVRPLLDSVVTLATAAAVTERIRLGFGVMVVPLRHPAWVAKQVASLQHLSGNRVILGLGSGGRVHGMAGWEAVRVPFAAGGRRLDAALDVLPRLIAGEPAPVDQRSRSRWRRVPGCLPSGSAAAPTRRFAGPSSTTRSGSRRWCRRSWWLRAPAGWPRWRRNASGRSPPSPPGSCWQVSGLADFEYECTQGPRLVDPGCGRGQDLPARPVPSSTAIV
jgi:Luciferase-like monooxygenase